MVQQIEEEIKNKIDKNGNLTFFYELIVSWDVRREKDAKKKKFGHFPIIFQR